MQYLALLLTGYSVFYAISLSLTYFNCENYKEHRLAQLMGWVLMCALAGLQLSHFFYLLPEGSDFIHSTNYVSLLFLVAPSFYLFSKPLLMGGNHFQIAQLLHFSPIILAFFLPFNTALLIAFSIGGLYLLWLGIRIYALRKQRAQFRVEIFMLGFVLFIAILVLILGLFLPIISEKLFFILYASAIGAAFLMINLVLNIAPKISDELVEAARETYEISTLSNVDCDKSLQALTHLMQNEKLYQENNIDLTTLAMELGLSSHQLSELMNTHLGKSFSRYIREYRVEAAKKLLLSEPKSSILSIGLDVGFSSQSNFYEAFREIVGSTPGKYRKLG